MDISRLREMRTRQRLRQEDVAEQAGIARTTYAGYEQGRKEPDHETLIRIAQVLGASVEYLLGLDSTQIDIKKREPMSSNTPESSFLAIANRLAEALDRQNAALERLASAQEIDAQARLKAAEAQTIDAQARLKTADALDKLSDSQAAAHENLSRAMDLAMAPHSFDRGAPGTVPHEAAE